MENGHRQTDHHPTGRLETATTFFDGDTSDGPDGVQVNVGLPGGSATLGDTQWVVGVSKDQNTEQFNGSIGDDTIVGNRCTGRLDC